jgi:signal transduction histidine kinase
MSRLSLRWRSVAAAASAIVLAVVVVGVGVDILVSRHLHGSLDRTLRARAVEVAQLAASAPKVLTTPGALDAPLGSTQLSIEVVDSRGRLVARSLALGGRVLPAQPLLRRAINGRPGYANIESAGDDLRAYSAPLADVGGPAAGGAVVVAGSTHDLDETLSSLRWFLFAAGLGAAVLAGAAVAVLMRRALVPLERLAGAAADVERTGDPSRRLPEPVQRDEVGRLAATLNAMLASLERSRDAERRFLADASHELRTPLTALRGNVAYLARHGASPELVAELEADAERLAVLADDLLTLSREESAVVPTEPVRLDDLARSAAEAYAHADVEAPEPVTVYGDHAALERALENLVRNAELYGPTGGRITLATEAVNGVARLSVSDEGSGPEDPVQAFARFWRGQHGEPGSGLGLAIVRATAERHGGRAYAEGSRFTIELPALRDLSESVPRTGA